MPRIPKAARHAAFLAQASRCYYCGTPMWERSPESFVSRYGFSRREVQLLRCTAEHLIARREGGSNAPENIVAAHAFCNHLRHKLPVPPAPLELRKRATQRMKACRWFPGTIGQRLGAPAG